MKNEDAPVVEILEPDPTEEQSPEEKARIKILMRCSNEQLERMYQQETLVAALEYISQRLGTNMFAGTEEDPYTYLTETPTASAVCAEGEEDEE